jgi:hypothetical protein
MKYNLAQFSQTIANTAVGDISLTTDEVIRVLNTTAAQIDIPVSGTTSGTLVLDSDLGARVHCSEIRYYFQNNNPIASTASGITFYYKNERFEAYKEVTTYYNANYYYTTLSGEISPRYIRMSHFATTSSGVSQTNGFQVINNEDYVDFGTDGTAIDHNFNLSVENNNTDVSELQVYNSGPIKANVKLFIEPQRTVADDILTISDSADGPWYGVYRSEDLIAAAGFWDNGSYDDTEEVAGVLQLDGGSTEGTYTTRIIQLDDYQRLTFTVLDHHYPIIVPEVEYLLDFSDADYQWNVDYINFYEVWWYDGYMAYDITAQDSASEIQVSTKRLDYEYGDDWQLTFRYKTRYHWADPNAGTYIYFMWPKEDFYLGNYAYGYPNQRFVLNETVHDVTGVFNWLANSVWLNFKLQRSFTVLRWKIWRTDSPEPAAWMWSITVAPGDLDIPLQGGIHIEDRVTRYGPISFDDFKLIKNFSASEGGTSVITVEEEDTLESLEVRSSNTRPLDRDTFVRYNRSGQTIYTDHYWIVDGSFAERSGSWLAPSSNLNGAFEEYWIDSVTGIEYTIDKPFRNAPTGGNPDWVDVYLRIRLPGGTLYTYHLYDGGSNSYDYYLLWSTYKVAPNYTGATWIYYFLHPNSSQGGNGTYYLRYFSATGSLQYTKSADGSNGSFAYDLSAVHNTQGDLWYTDRDLSTVFKISSGGSILASFLATEDIRGVLALDDGGCWFIRSSNLVRLDTNAEPIDTIELPSPNASYVYSDFDGGFYLQVGYEVYHLTSTGEVLFSIYLNNLYWITPLQTGFITKQHDGTTSNYPIASYVSNIERRVMSTWNYPSNEGALRGTFDSNRLGARSQAFDDTNGDHSSHFPIPVDDAWGDTVVEWTSVSLRDYTYTSEQYHQLRLTLRADTSANSPKVAGIYTQRAIELPDVHPNQYGTFYLRTDITDLNEADVGDYTSDVRAFWYLNTE